MFMFTVRVYNVYSCIVESRRSWVSIANAIAIADRATHPWAIIKPDEQNWPNDLLILMGQLEDIALAVVVSVRAVK